MHTETELEGNQGETWNRKKKKDGISDQAIGNVAVHCRCVHIYR